MDYTRSQLKQIIKEEIEKAFHEKAKLDEGAFDSFKDFFRSSASRDEDLTQLLQKLQGIEDGCRSLDPREMVFYTQKNLNGNVITVMYGYQREIKGDPVNGLISLKYDKNAKRGSFKGIAPMVNIDGTVSRDQGNRVQTINFDIKNGTISQIKNALTDQFVRTFVGSLRAITVSGDRAAQSRADAAKQADAKAERERQIQFDREAAAIARDKATYTPKLILPKAYNRQSALGNWKLGIGSVFDKD